MEDYMASVWIQRTKLFKREEKEREERERNMKERKFKGREGKEI